MFDWFSRRVLDIAEMHGHTVGDLLACMANPKEKWRSYEDNADVLLGEKFALIQADSTGDIIGLMSVEAARKQRQQPRRNAVRRSKGKAGTRGPTSFEDLVKLAQKHPLLDVENGSKHRLIINRDTGAKVTIPVSTSDHARAVKNSLADIRNVLGVDLKG